MYSIELVLIILEFFLLVAYPFLYTSRKTVLTECKEYSGPKKREGNYKVMRDAALNPAYKSVLNLYQRFRTDTANDLKKDEGILDILYGDIYRHLNAVDFLKKKVSLDELKEGLDIKYIHREIEQYITRTRGGGPDQIINTTQWDDYIPDTDNLFYGGVKKIHRNMKLSKRGRQLDGLFLCSIPVALIIFVLSVILFVLDINSIILSVDCSLFFLCIGLIVIVLSFIFYLGIIMTKRGLEKVYENATENIV